MSVQSLESSGDINPAQPGQLPSSETRLAPLRNRITALIEPELREKHRQFLSAASSDNTTRAYRSPFVIFRIGVACCPVIRAW